jgi:hypothetical protein
MLAVVAYRAGADAFDQIAPHRNMLLIGPAPIIHDPRLQMPVWQGINRSHEPASAVVPPTFCGMAVELVFKLHHTPTSYAGMLVFCPWSNDLEQASGFCSVGLWFSRLRLCCLELMVQVYRGTV